MSKGSITDFHVKILPSQKLLEFLLSLEDVQQMPENVVKILKANGKKKDKVEIFNDFIKSESLTKAEREILEEFQLESNDFDAALKCLEIVESDEDEDEDIEIIGNDGKEEHSKKDTPLNLNDLKWINKTLTEKRLAKKTSVYLHELLEGSKLILPKNDYIPRNPQLEARCVKLREEQENRVYRNMTRDVDAVRRTLPEDTIAYQMRSMNSQIIAVLQFVFSVVAGFAFGFIGVDLIIGNLDFGFRLLLGIICALTIALAEIYFLAKKLNELDDMHEE